MRKVWTNLGLVIALLLLCVAAITPPSENLRLGKDLAGGVSLIYSVNLDEVESEQQAAIDQMIDVLARRVNPAGTLEISFTQQGRDRVEITMPLPSEAVTALRDAYQQELERFGDFALDVDAFERAMRARGADRRAQLEALMDSDPRATLLQPVLDASDGAAQAREEFELGDAAFEQARESGATELIDPLRVARDEALDAAGAAVETLEEARTEALARVVTLNELRRAIEQPEAPIIKPSEQSDEPVTLPSERTLALESIREKVTGLPGAEALIGPPMLVDQTIGAGEQTVTIPAVNEEIERPAGSILQAYEAYQDAARGLDDPNELKRLLRGAGVLEFRIAADPQADRVDIPGLRERFRALGPENFTDERFVWVPINKLDDWFDYVEELADLRSAPQPYFQNRFNLIAEPAAGTYYILMHDTPGMRLTKAEGEGEWGLTGASQGTDPRTGRPSVNYRMNPRGAVLLAELTEPNIERNMAIILDGRAYTAPNIVSRLSNSVQVTGNFTQVEINQLVQTLEAGSLTATLSERPISENTIAPELGKDNLLRGLEASQWALIAVGCFMIAYYFSMGAVALMALAANAVIILGAMALARSSFTLPGIAGVVLTFGMAVDANVLIYERIREELKAGENIRAAVRVAFQKVLSTIVDANVTNLIVCFVLFYTATQEIKGFAVTLGIGVVGTMFSSLIISRLIFSAAVDRIKIKNLSQLPLAVPVIDKVLTPKVDWIGLRPVFYVISAALLLTGGGLIWIQQDELLDTEFRGGTVVDIRLQQPELLADGEGNPDAGEAIILSRSEVEERVQALGSQAQDTLAADPGDEQAAILADLRTAEIQAVNPQANGIDSDRFKIKTVADQPDIVVDAITREFEGLIASTPALTFRGSETLEWTGADSTAPVYEIVDPVLGRNDIRGIGPEFADRIDTYLGGVAILLENLQPRPSEDQLRERLAFLRTQDPFASTALRRDFDLKVLETEGEGVATAVVLVRDPAISPLTDKPRWERELASQEWELARAALTDRQTLAGVQSFSPSIARTFRAQAIVAVILSLLLILVYIWVRFGSPRYSFAAILALLHDVVAVVGLIALAEIIYKVTDGASAAYGILPFKIDLGLIAALLTIIGYSLNDTIVILDRVRENRGRLPYASRDVVNLSINQTISRTLITSGTTLVALTVLFLRGGEGLASFTYALLCGVVVGTYSSIAVAAPTVYTSKIPPISGYRGTPDAPLEGGAPIPAA
ncbi:MAG: protein translocase subunit SecD [Planctomycetota bacterium]